MPTTFMYRAVPAILTASLLITGCSALENASSHSRSSSTTSRPSSRLPDGITKMGSARPVADGAWTLSLQGFERSQSEVEPGTPPGWHAYTARMTMTNKRSRIATAPQTALTARYGALGRQAHPKKAATQPKDTEPVRVRPNGSVTTQVQLAFPPQAEGKRVTVTAETTPEGLAEPELLFFEGTLPGRTSASSPGAHGPDGGGDSPDATRLGQWHDGSLRLSTVSATGKGASRTARFELNVANRGPDPMPGLQTTLRVFTGQDLHPAATIRPVYGYHDAAIAPHRTATQTVTFRVPQSAVGEPVTIEAVGVDGTRVPFEGQLG